MRSELHERTRDSNGQEILCMRHPGEEQNKHQWNDCYTCVHILARYRFPAFNFLHANACSTVVAPLPLLSSLMMMETLRRERQHPLLLLPRQSTAIPEDTFSSFLKEAGWKRGMAVLAYLVYPADLSAWASHFLPLFTTFIPVLAKNVEEMTYSQTCSQPKWIFTYFSFNVYLPFATYTNATPKLR